jgi:hypothetical protein
MAKRKAASADKGPFTGIKLTLGVVLEGNTQLDLKADVETFADLTKLAKKLQDNVSGIKKVLPDLASKKVEKVYIVTE